MRAEPTLAAVGAANERYRNAQRRAALVWDKRERWLEGFSSDSTSETRSEAATGPASPASPLYPVVHVQGSSAIRRPLLVLAVCAIVAVLYVGRDFLIPTAGAVVLALILM